MDFNLLTDYLSEPAAATALGVHFKTLMTWRKRGTGPAFTRLGRRVMYRRGAIAAWLQAQEQAA